MVRLLIAAPGRTWPVELPAGSTHTLGRGRGADVRVEDPALAGEHLLLRCSPEGEVVAEALGQTLLNGVQLSGRALVRPGDELSLGHTAVIIARPEGQRADEQRAWSWQAFRWLVEDALSEGEPSLVLLRDAPALPEGDLLWTELGPSAAIGCARDGGEVPEAAAAQAVSVRGREAVDADSLLELLLSRALGVPPLLGDEEWVVHDPVMQRLLALAERLHHERASVLVSGERGSGRAVVARRCASAAVAWNGQGAPPPGALFVRELGRLEPSARARVQAALDAGRQLVATAERDVEVRGFAHQLAVPPLRLRPADVEPLAELFLARARRALQLPRMAISASARAALRGYAFPGNVRELKIGLERAALLQQGDELRPDALPEEWARASERAGPALGLRASLRSTERELLLQTLGATDWNVSETARRLGLPRRTVVYRMGRLGVRRPRR